LFYFNKKPAFEPVFELLTSRATAKGKEEDKSSLTSRATVKGREEDLSSSTSGVIKYP